ncbi:MAG: hypothetical protein VW239_01240, partial [Candidatus Nanopelagicales bacterium]
MRARVLVPLLLALAAALGLIVGAVLPSAAPVADSPTADSTQSGTTAPVDPTDSATEVTPAPDGVDTVSEVMGDGG